MTSKIFAIQQNHGQFAKGTSEQCSRLIANTSTSEENDLQQTEELYRHRLNGTTLHSKVALANTPVAGWSLIARKKIPEGSILCSHDTSAKHSVPFVACAPHAEFLNKYVDDDFIRESESSGNPIATHNAHIINILQSCERMRIKFVASRNIEEGDILAQDYVTFDNIENRVASWKLVDVGVAGDWLIMGVTPSLMTKKGASVPDVSGRVKTHFIEGVQIRGNAAKLKFTVLPVGVKLDPEQKIVGKIGETLYAYDERLHESFKSAFGSKLTAEPLDIREFFQNPRIADAFYPPIIKKQKAVSLPSFLPSDHKRPATSSAKGVSGR